MLNTNFSSQYRATFKVWPKGFRNDIFFKNYFSFSPDIFPTFNSYFYKSNGSTRFRFRSVVVRSAQYGYVSDRSIEAFRKIVAPYFRKKGYYKVGFFIHIYPYMPLTKKPAEVRMGGGKGSKLRGFFSPVRPGQLLFSILSVHPIFAKKLLRYAKRKLSIKTSVFCILSYINYLLSNMAFINNNSKIFIIDNSGVTKFRVIGINRASPGRVGDICVGSLNKVKPRRRLRKGQIFRSLLVQSRRLVSRIHGSFIRSLSTRAILVKRSEDVPLANRLNSFYFIELRRLDVFKLSAMTIYVV